MLVWQGQVSIDGSEVAVKVYNVSPGDGKPVVWVGSGRGLYI